jgi:DNA-binding NtrC family response regulator
MAGPTTTAAHDEDHRPSRRRPCIGGRLDPVDLPHLQRLAEVVTDARDEIAEHWTRGHRAHHPDGALAGEALSHEAGGEIEAIVSHIRRGDPDGLLSEFERRGLEIASRGVPFGEVCCWLKLFEESVVRELRQCDLPAEEVLDLVIALGRLGHERRSLLIEAYHGHCRSQWVQCREAALRRAARLERDIAGRDRLCGLIGRSLPMQRLYERLELAARCRDTVFLVGESGTGKELAAQAIYALGGGRPDGFVPVNCAALPPDLIENELFGHQRGAFSGADWDHPGLFGAAQGGSIFLDEVTELTPAAQAKLLRVLQERAIRPVGSTREVPISVRVLASSNGDPQKALSEGRLRRDLYYRLQEMVIRTPPLRDRTDDIPLLVEHFVAGLVSTGATVRVFTPDAIAALARRPWPGNVRELENAVRHVYRLAESGVVEARDVRRALGAEAGGGEREPGPAEPGPLSIKHAERDAIARALRETAGNKTRAAAILGISRKQLYVKIRSYGLAPA